jgi:hypothetical protein
MMTLQMNGSAPPVGRGRGGRGAPFGNSMQPRPELRRPLQPTGADYNLLAQQLGGIDLKNSFNINAHEFMPT